MKRKKLWWVLLAVVLVAALFVGVRWFMQRTFERQHRMDAWWGVKSYTELTKKLKDSPIVLLEEAGFGFGGDVQYGTWMDGPEDDRRPVGYSASGSVSLEDETYRLGMDGGPVAVLGAPEGNVLSAYRGTEIHSRRIFLQNSVEGKTRRQVITAIELDGIVYRTTITYDTLDVTAEALQAREDILEQKNVELLQTIIDRYFDRS